MDGKIVLLMIAVVAVGMFALPSTLALYSGQHTFINGSNVDCDKCHGASAGITWTGGAAGELNATNNTAHTALTCESCHSTTTATIESDYHAAAAVGASCIGCHSGPGAENISGATENDILVQLRGASEVHDNMTSTEGSGNTSKDYACIACHTEATVTGTINLTAGTVADITLLNNGTW